jgi:hypothetical protein
MRDARLAIGGGAGATGREVGVSIGQDGGPTVGVLSTHGVADVIQVWLENLAIEEPAGVEGLVGVEAAPCAWTAQGVRQASSSGTPISRGWRWGWKRCPEPVEGKIERLIHRT